MDEADVTFEVWERNLNTREVKRRHHGDRGFNYQMADHLAAVYNKDEAEIVRFECRTGPTREFFVVKATTTFEEQTL